MARAISKFLHFFLVILFVLHSASAQEENNFIYKGFRGNKLLLDGNADIHPSGILQLTNTSKQVTGHAFYRFPLTFNSSSSGSRKDLSFSTNFVFAMVPEFPDTASGHGIAFVISPSMDLSRAVASQYLGLFNISSNGRSSNHVLAVEFDTIKSPEFGDIDDNHVGIDINGLISNVSAPVSYYSDGKNVSLRLINGHPIQVWIEYDEVEMLLNVSLAPTGIPKPSLPLLSASVDLSLILLDNMYVGFSSATGAIASNHYLLGWSFSKTGQAQSLDISELPPLPQQSKPTQEENHFIYKGFHGANVQLDGNAVIHPGGILQLTTTSKQTIGHAFYRLPLKFNSSPSGLRKDLSFSTNFVIAMVPEFLNTTTSGHGIAFVISPSMDFSRDVASQYLGLFNISSNGLPSNHVLAVEFDTIKSPEFEDINDNHVGIDINSLKSIVSAPVTYYSEGKNVSLKLINGHPIQVWIEYDEVEQLLNVSLAPTGIPKPRLPLLSAPVDLSLILLDYMYVGFSSATGAIASNHYVLGWSFNKSGESQSLDISELPILQQSKSSKGLEVKGKIPIITIVTLTALGIMLGMVA